MVAARVYYTADLQEAHKEVGVAEASKNQVKVFGKSHFLNACIPKTAKQSEFGPNTSSKRKGPLQHTFNNGSSSASD